MRADPVKAMVNRLMDTARPAPAVHRSPGQSSRDRLDAIVVELLDLFGAGGFAGMALMEIHNRVRTDEQARQILERVHARTAPPYR